MTTDRPRSDRTPAPCRRRRRPHPARTARIVSTGAAATLTFGVIAALTLNEPAAQAAAPRVVGIDPGILVPGSVSSGNLASPVPPPPTVIWVRRIHVLPAAAPVAAAVADPAFAPPVAATAFRPLPAARVGTARVRTARVRTARVRTARVRVAKARSRAS